MAFLSFCRLSLSNSFLPYKTVCYSRFSTTGPLSKLSVEEKLGIKPKPKRPKSSFLKFVSQIKPQILQNKPNATITEINRIAGERWRATDDKTKANLAQEFKVEWNKYLDELKKYDLTLSAGQKEEIQKANETLFENKKKKKLKQKMEELGKPKKPPSTFVMFMQSKVQERGNIPFREWQQKVTKEWESAPELLKTKLNENYQKEMERFKVNLEKWEKKMKKDGHQELTDERHDEKSFVLMTDEINGTYNDKKEFKSKRVELKMNKNPVPSKNYRLVKFVCLSIVTLYSLVIFSSDSSV